MYMLQDKKCQFIFDGVNSEKIRKLYLPSPFDDYSGPRMGRYVSYEWDKYIIDNNDECVFDYKGNFGGLESTLLDIQRNADEPIGPGDVCAFIFYFKSAACGAACEEEDLSMYMFTYIDTQIYRDFWGQLFYYAYFNFLIIAYLPLGWLLANVNDFEAYSNFVMLAAKDGIPYKC